ncbi:hypothetical protein B0I00_1343 [Novosphingobium kunmingense]|uniref:Beta-barrel assembly machine subunit BamE n=1 Tax=Novosphingobium kunmingense TaxID=1211806 RepID=A0A2N0HJR2_9SPHN|nr:hypothetical protein [Novosphingobium kunmingense]PKB19115.1 hypothetical protein B0I00_1343 [Novosphingobium kunmingense]
MTALSRALAPLACLALVAGCSSPEAPAADQSASGEASDAATLAPTEAPGATASPTASPSPKDITLKLEGLGDLVIGKSVPATSRFAVRGAQTPGSSCITYSSPDYPGVYALAEGGTVRRISVGGTSTVKLVEGVGIGSSEADVLKSFPGFRSEPHKYVAAPAKYLTQPGNDPRLRFEIGENGRVSIMHVGIQPQLTYVEGCA